MNTPSVSSSPVLIRRSVSGTGLNHLSKSNSSHSLANSTMGNATYRASLVSHFAEDLERRRRAERIIDECRSDMVPYDVLKIDTVEMYPRDNAKEHRTERYELLRDSNPSTVLRRGQAFFMALRLKDRALDPRRDILRISFIFGASPQVTKNTKVVLPFRLTQRDFTRAPQNWDVRLHQQDGFVLTLQVHIPANALVGLWRCVIETTSSVQGSRCEEFRCKDDIYILFNPFCRDDPVYLDSEDLRREYVMNETGKVFMGTHQRPKGRRWIYGQFSDVVLPAIQLLMEMSGLNATERGNPVQVVRAISSVINSTESDEGLLEGKWEGAFEDGTSPWAWTGSSKIFEQFLRNGCKAVKYGQCWVFSAIATTICRALGIPSRPVTNFVSARDTNHTMSVDKYFDSYGDEIKGGPDGDGQDSIWNFHAWTEVWMARPDLPNGYGGWQAIDSTPQSITNDKMQCGPASVEAVRRGEVGFAFNTPIVFAEVNADLQHFQEDESSHWGFKKVKVNSYHVCRQILTKRAGVDDDIGDSDADDITKLYKNLDDMARLQNPVLPVSLPFVERDMIPFPGSAQSDRAPGSPPRAQFDFLSKCNDDVFFDLVEMEKIAYGQPFAFTIQILNRSQDVRTISTVLNAMSTYYTGSTIRRLARTERQIILQPGQRESVQVRVTWEDYRDKIVDYAMVKFYALAIVQETKQIWSEEEDFQLEKPKLDVQIRGISQVNHDCYITFSFLNPLPMNLTECEFTFECQGLFRPQTVKYRDVKVGEMVSHTQKFTPRQGGERKLVATFNSRELIDVVGSRPITVRD